MEITAAGVGYPVAVMGALGLIFGALLAFASIKFAVPVDERVAKIRELLSGGNCGGCGFAGCDAYAEAVARGEAPAGLCGPGGASVAADIAKIMGVAGGEIVPKIAFLKCAGSPEKSPSTLTYDGVADCREAVSIPGGSPNACPFGCVGLGSCVRACNFGAMKIVDGLASVDASKCVGCRACVDVCPKKVLTLVPKDAAEMVRCSSTWRGPDVRKVCSVGCIGCGICAKVCPSGAITFANNIAVIDPAICTACGACAEKCPAKCIETARTA